MAGPTAFYRIRARDETGQAFASFSRRLQVATVAVRSFRRAFLGTLGAGAIIAFFRGITNEADRFQKLSQQLGTTTNFLSELAFAAQINGSSLNDLESGLRRLQKTVGDASNGLQTARRSLNQLGFEAEDLRRLNPEQQFFAIVKALNEVEDQTKAATLRLDIFGRGVGGRLAPLINSGVSSIEELREEARRLGISIDQFTADSAAEFNDTLTRLGAAAKGAGLAILKELVEPFETFTNYVKQFVNPVLEVTRTLFTTLGQIVGGTAAALVSFYSGEFRQAFEIAKRTFQEAKENFADLFELIKDPVNQTKARRAARQLKDKVIDELARIPNIPIAGNAVGRLFDDDIKSISSLVSGIRTAIQAKRELEERGSAAEFDVSLQALTGRDISEAQRIDKALTAIEQSIQQRELAKIMIEVRDILARQAEDGGATAVFGT